MIDKRIMTNSVLWQIYLSHSFVFSFICFTIIYPYVMHLLIYLLLNYIDNLNMRIILHWKTDITSTRVFKKKKKLAVLCIQSYIGIWCRKKCSAWQSELIMLKSSAECVGWGRGTPMLVEEWMLPGWVFGLFQTQNIPDVVHY